MQLLDQLRLSRYGYASIRHSTNISWSAHRSESERKCNEAIKISVQFCCIQNDETAADDQGTDRTQQIAICPCGMLSQIKVSSLRQRLVTCVTRWTQQSLTSEFLCSCIWDYWSLRKGWGLLRRSRRYGRVANYFCLGNSRQRVDELVKNLHQITSKILKRNVMCKSETLENRNYKGQTMRRIAKERPEWWHRWQGRCRSQILTALCVRDLAIRFMGASIRRTGWASGATRSSL